MPGRRQAQRSDKAAMKFYAVISARLQFIKAKVVSKAIQEANRITDSIFLTGQHFDSNMFDVLFNQLNMPRLSHQLDIHGGNHIAMMGRLLKLLEALMLQEQTDQVMVYEEAASSPANADRRLIP